MKKGERLSELQEKQRVSESQFEGCETRKQEILAELNKSKDLMRNQDQLRRNIEDNLNYRKTKAEVDELTRDIESLEERIMKIGGVSTVEAELRKLSQERERLLSEVYRRFLSSTIHLIRFLSALFQTEDIDDIWYCIISYWIELHPADHIFLARLISEKKSWLLSLTFIYNSRFLSLH